MPSSVASAGSPASLRPALLWQLSAGLAGMLVALWRFDLMAALGVGFGVLVVMSSTVLLARRIHGAADVEPEQGQRMLYAGAVSRFVLVLAALMLAYGVGLHLMAVAAGMVVAQAAMFTFALGGLKGQARKTTV